MAESRNLDLLRTVAVLLVLVDHLFMAAGLASSFPIVYDIGKLGVLLFFVHTSLVLMLSLERTQSREGGHLFRAFYIRRAFRIYPLTVACVLLCTVFRVPQQFGSAASARSVFQVATNLLLVQNLAGQSSVISPLWSLPLEIQMYVVLPFLFVFAGRHSAKALLALGCSLALAGLAYERLLDMHVIAGLKRLDILNYAPCFVAGVMAYRLSTNRARRPVLASWLWPAAVGSLVALYGGWQVAFPHPLDRIPAYRGWVVCWILGAIIPQFREIRLGWLRKASHYVAKYSYGIYLGQVPALWIGFTFWPHMGGILRWLVSVALLAGIAVGGYHLIEHPGISVGKRVADRSNRSRSRPMELQVGA